MARGLRNALILPNWAQGVGKKIAYAIVRVADLMVEVIREGTDAWHPGLGTPTALPLIAQSRGLLQGPNEPDDMFAARCIAWLDTYQTAGGDETLAQEVQGFLTGAGTLGARVLPTVRVVDRSGNCVTANPDGTTTKTIILWNWDSVLGWDDGRRAVRGPDVSDYWSDVWILVSPNPFPRYTGTSDPAWLANFGAPNGLGGGHQVSRQYVDGVLAIVHQWKGAHVWIRNLIWCSDVTTFVPDGTYGNFSKNVGGVQVPGRDPTARYWDLPSG